MKTIKRQLAVAVTVALLALPLSTSMVLADTDNPSLATTLTTTEATLDETDLDTAVTDDTTADDTTADDTTADDTTADDTTADDTTADDTTTDETTPVTDSDGKEVAPSNWLSNLIGKLQLALTFDPVRKGQLNERQALAKLAEAQKLLTEGNAEASEIALNKYTEKIAKAQEFLEQVEDPESEEAQKLTIALTNVNTNNINVLSNLLEKLPPQAAQRVALNVVRSMERAVNKAEKQEAEDGVDAVDAVDAVAIPSETTALETVPTTITPATELVTTSAPAAKAVAKDIPLEKQAKVALKVFKKTLQEKHNIELDDAKQPAEENEVAAKDSIHSPSDEVLSVSNNSSQPTSVTIAPAQLEKAPARVKSSVQEKREQAKPGAQGNDKSREKSDNRANKSDQRD